MKKRPFCFVGLLSVAIVISLALLLYGQTPTPLKISDKQKTITKNNAKEPKTLQKDAKGSSSLPIFPVSKQSSMPSTDKTDNHNDKPMQDQLIKVFTGVIAGATILQFLALLWQTHWMRKTLGVAQQTAEAVRIQVETMRDELALKHRSKIHVRDIAIPYFEDPFGKGEFLEGQLGIVNLGGMSANIVSIGAWFEIGYEKGFPTEWPDESEKPNIPNPQPTKLEVGQSATYKFADERSPLSSYESIRIGKADCTLYVIGYVKYTDTTKLPRYSRFFREYRLPKDQFGGRKEERRFIPVEGYEYEE